MAKPPKTILVVDDDPEILSMLQLRLEHRGYKVLTASDGKEAPALMILDVMMPSKNGWEVARALKQDPVTEGIKILMLTAIGAQVNEMTSPLYGADAHLDKPFNFNELDQTLERLLAD